eukprot:2471013-Rhodomonas_salina.3
MGNHLFGTGCTRSAVSFGFLSLAISLVAKLLPLQAPLLSSHLPAPSLSPRRTCPWPCLHGSQSRYRGAHTLLVTLPQTPVAELLIERGADVKSVEDENQNGPLDLCSGRAATVKYEGLPHQVRERVRQGRVDPVW